MECVDAAEAFLERAIPVEREAEDTFCRLRGGAIVSSAVVAVSHIGFDCFERLGQHTKFSESR